MKILAFTDNHEDWKSIVKLKILSKKHNPTLLICAGDISIFSHHLFKALKLLNQIGKPVLIVSGNHEDHDELNKACKQFSNLRFIDRKICSYHEYVICGYGGGGFATRDQEFVKYAKVFKQKMRNKKSILVLHQPPYGTKVDFINSHHAGNKSFTDFIKDTKPNLVICGHLHETAGKEGHIKKTRIVNPGWNGQILEV